MESAGWQLARPSGSSYWAVKDGSGKRHDHAFVSNHFRIIGAEYITDRGPFMFAGKGREALSDHAALLVDVELRSLSSFSGAS